MLQDLVPYDAHSTTAFRLPDMGCFLQLEHRLQTKIALPSDGERSFNIPTHAENPNISAVNLPIKGLHQLQHHLQVALPDRQKPI